MNNTCHLCGEKSQLKNKPSIAVVIPCYKVKSSILSVLNSIGKDIDKIYVVDDSCPEGTGKYVVSENNDSLTDVRGRIDNCLEAGIVTAKYFFQVKSIAVSKAFS